MSVSEREKGYIDIEQKDRGGRPYEKEKKGTETERMGWAKKRRKKREV